MITFRMTTDVKDDRQIVLTLPAEVPIGHAELLVSIEFRLDNGAPTGFADWLEVQPGRNGTDQARYPLRGSVVRYDQPTESAAEGDWEALA